MTTYAVCKGVTAIQTLPNGGGLPAGSTMASPGSFPNAQNQTFQVVVTGTSGNVSATVQPIVSNDGVNWSNYGSAIATGIGTSPQQGIGPGAQAWQYFSAYVTAISGTGASVTCTMAA